MTSRSWKCFTRAGRFANTTPSASIWPRWKSCLWEFGVAAVWIAVAVNWTVRDSIPILTLVYYAMPPIVAGATALTLAWVGRRSRGTFFGRMSPSANRSAAAIGVICLLQWSVENFRHGPTDELPPATIKLAFWNVGRGHFANWERIANQLREMDADVIALAEATDEKTLTPDFWSDHMPGYSALPLGSGLAVLAKGSLVRNVSSQLGATGEYRHLSIVILGTPFDLILADIESHPYKSRQGPLTRLFELMQQDSKLPTVTVGDFNTPPGSVWFDRWRSEWSRAWEVAGSGYQATWPQPLPVLALDHVWGNRGVTFHRCIPGWSSCSDHRPITVQFSVVPELKSQQRTAN